MSNQWAGIVRVSHMGDRRAGAEDFHADRDQVAGIERAIPPGATLDLLPPELGVSGGLPIEKRPVLLRAVEGVEDGTYAGIVVAYLSRLGRNTREQLRAWDRVEAAGGRIICAAEGIDTSTPSGRFIRTIMLANAEREREEHQERFENLREWATAAGVWQRRQTPLGYVRDPETRRLTPTADAARVVQAFEDRSAEIPVIEIARRLGMTPQGARCLLRNRVYLGELRVGEHVNPVAHSAIVTPEAWEAAQQPAVRRGRTAKEPALLARLVRCCGCGHAMTRGGAKRYPSYVCAPHKSGATCSAPAHIGVALLDAYVDETARAELAKLAVEREATGSVVDARAAVEVAKRELDAYVASVSAADIGPEAFSAGARARREALDDAQKRERAERAKQRCSKLTDGAAAWDKLTVGERNIVLRDMLACVLVERSGGRGVRRPLPERVRVIAAGSRLVLPERRGGISMGVQPIVLPDVDDPSVLGPAASEHTLQGERSAA